MVGRNIGEYEKE